jgi:hypothetical protein
MKGGYCTVPACPTPEWMSGKLGDVVKVLLMHHPYAIAGAGAGAYDKRSGGHGMHSVSAHVTLGIHTVRYRWVMSK